MRASQILYIFLFVGIVAFIIKSTHLLERIDGFQNLQSEPVIPNGLIETKLETKAQPNPSAPGTLPFAPYGQTAAVGSYQYQDPSQLPAELKQIKQLYEDIRSFMIFEGVSVEGSSDPTVSLPLTQLRADSRRLQQEVAVLNGNPGIQASLTQQQLADIQGALTFLQRKVRLFQTAGVINDGVEGFVDAAPKIPASKTELQLLQNKIYAAILTLSASGTTDPVTQARIKSLQAMYSETTDIINKLDKGTMKANEVPYYSQDIKVIIPKLADPKSTLMDLSAQGSGEKLNMVEQQLATYVGKENAKSVFKDIRKNGMFRVNVGVDLGYNTKNEDNTEGKPIVLNKKYQMDPHGLLNLDRSNNNPAMNSIGPSNSINVDGPYDNTMSGMDDRAEAVQKRKSPSRLDWEKRAKDICRQVKLRGLDPLDFGCIPEGSKMSPAYSWRGHAKMVCGRLGATMDPGLPSTCGCPPANWKGWTLADCLPGPPVVGQSASAKNCSV
jgi:hypothetical protein